MLNKPQKTKYPFFHKLKIPQHFNSKAKNLKLTFALISNENSILMASQLLASILTIKRKLKQNLILFIRTFPHLPVTKRPPEQPLGKGKSNIVYWATPIKIGTIIFELQTDNIILAKTALKAASYKLPFKTQIINKPRLN